MNTEKALRVVRREIRMLAIAAATESIRDRAASARQRRGQAADILRLFDETARQLAAPGLSAIAEIERGLRDGGP